MTGDALVALPPAILAGGALGVYLLARFVTGRNGVLALFTAAVFGAALAALVRLARVTDARTLPSWGRIEPRAAYLQAEPGALAIIGVALGLGALVAIYSGRYLALDQRYETYYPLLLLAVTGLTGMLLAADLFNFYLLCELMSASVYVLVGFRRHTQTAIEASFKYLVMGSVGTVTLLAGISFIYRETGQLVFSGSAAVPGPWTRAGLACLLVGLGLKSAIVPLHTWLPDAHGRAPSSVSAMLSGIIVQSAFYGMVKMCLGWGLPAQSLGLVLIVLSLLNMTLGNALALVQTHTKRLLAYSTIAQMGYLMLVMGLGLRYQSTAAIEAAFFIVIGQAAMKGLAFLCKGVDHFYRGATLIAELRGMVARVPSVAVAFSIALVGLAGVPPLAGFTGKWFILTNAVRPREILGYAGLVFFLLNTLLGLGYYLPLVATLFSSSTREQSVAVGVDQRRTRVSGWMMVPIATLAVLVVLIGIWPGPWLGLARDAGDYLLSLGR